MSEDLRCHHDVEVKRKAIELIGRGCGYGAAARAVVDEGMTKADAMAAFGIASLSPLKQWCKAYREGVLALI